MNRHENSSGAIGARNARACDSCLRRRARWYCAADDAFLCQLCDSSVHSANPLARRHERVRLKTAISSDFIPDDEPMWHHGCKRKARSSRGTSRSPEVKQEGEVSDRKPPRPDPMVPDMETVSIENFAMVEEEQLLYRVPIFDPVLAEFSSPQLSEDEVKNPMLSSLQQPMDCTAGFLLPPEIDIGEFEMDMESLLRQGLVEDAFCMEFLGSTDSKEDSGGGTLFLPVKEEGVEDNEGSSATAAQFDGETFNISFDSESEEEEKVAVAEGCGVRKRRRIMLNLDYGAVISAWSTQGCPWTDGTRPQLNPDDCWPEYTVKKSKWRRKKMKKGLESGKAYKLPKENVNLRIPKLCAGTQSIGLSSLELEKNIPIAKMCGITSAKDAELAAMAGADLIGMIIWPKSKRTVSTSVGKEISKVARECGAKPVGVFVDDDMDTILRAYDTLDLEFVQLHGGNSRVAFPHLVKRSRVIYVLHAGENGELLNHITGEESSSVDWLLVDSATGGSGKGFDWRKFKKPSVRSKLGWLLAGGLNPENVREAIVTLRPQGVDVSSGICSSDGIQKDPRKILSFMDNLRSP